MPRGRQPAKQDQPRNVVVATKVTPEERDRLVRDHGSTYLGLRAAVDRLLEDRDED